MNQPLNGQISHWMHGQKKQQPIVNFPDERQNLTVVGGGLTGLWTAFFAKKRNPHCEVTVIEKEQLGFSASGRNGGWLSTLLPGNRSVYARASHKQGLDGDALIRDFQAALFDSIDEVLDVLKSYKIDADQHQGGNLYVARNSASLQRLKKLYETDKHWGYSDDNIQILSADESMQRIRVTNTLGAIYYPRTVALDPAKLVLGLGEVLEDMGVRICEKTTAEHVESNVVFTSRGKIFTDEIVVALEAHTGSIGGKVKGLGKREVVPVNSAMIATRPLSWEFWDEIGWSDRDCLDDFDHTFVYAQRTIDDRIAIGGRGYPYRFGSKTAGYGHTESRTIGQLTDRLDSFFPGYEFPVDHVWKGNIGVTRDWCPGVFYDTSQHIAVVRGFAGHGVTASHLSAKTMLDLIDRNESSLTRLPWVNYSSKAWEPEPLRWIGIHAMYKLFEIADTLEYRSNSGKTHPIAVVGSHIAGLAGK